MNDKVFISADEIRDRGLLLFRQILNDGFYPDVLYVVLRGGAYLGNVMSECFKFFETTRPVFYAAVVAKSYSQEGERKNVKIEGWTYDPSKLNKNAKVLFVDDIYDTGRTIEYLANTVIEQGIPKENVKIAVFNHKVYKNNIEVVGNPDYYCRKIDGGTWVHYLNHELIGLTDKELDTYFSKEAKKVILELEKIKSPIK